MTTFGFHYYPDDSHYRLADWQAWQPELRALGARWLTLVGSPTRAIPEAFIKAVVDEGITPLIHLPATPIQPARDSAPTLEPLFKTYARWGVKYVVVFSEPNTRAAWPAAEWGKSGLVERFLDLALPVLQAEADAGLQPVFPALKAGGEYWDTSFLEASLAGLERRGQMALARQLTFAVNLWTFNRPATWGAGGLARWPEARPYLTPPGSQDQRGFHLFEWHAEIIRARLGESRPMICLAGGPRLGEQSDDSQSPTDEARHASCAQDIVRAALENQLPDYVLNVNFWLLCAAESSPFAKEAWYHPERGPLAAVDALKHWAARQPPEQSGAKYQPPERSEAKSKEAGASPKNGNGKLIAHYLLLPTFEWGVSEWHWQAALDYVKAHRPTCGFSIEEAKRAQMVTIMGNEQGINAEAEAALRQAGCTVERLVVKDARALAHADDRRHSWTPRSRL
jgi:hypothetical protein